MAVKLYTHFLTSPGGWKYYKVATCVSIMAYTYQNSISLVQEYVKGLYSCYASIAACNARRSLKPMILNYMKVTWE